MSIFGSKPSPPPPPPPPPNPPMFGQDIPKKKAGALQVPSPAILGAQLAPATSGTGQKTLLGQ